MVSDGPILARRNGLVEMGETSESPALTGVQKATISAYTEASAQVSTSVRALSLSLIAVCWLFLGGVKQGTPDLLTAGNPALRLAMLLALVALVLDLVQYAIAAAASQRIADSLDVVFYEAERPEGDHRSSRHWNRLAGHGLVEDFIRVAYDGRSDLYPPKAATVADVKSILGTAIKRPVDQRTDRDTRVLNFLKNDWNPGGLTWLVTTAFWLKVGLLFVSSIVLLVSIIRPELGQPGSLQQELRAKSSVEAVRVDYEAAVSEAAASVARLIPAVTWRLQPGTSTACDLTYATTDAMRAHEMAVVNAPLSDSAWPQAVRIVQAVASKFGANDLTVLSDKPESREIGIKGPAGIQFRLSSRLTTVVSAESDCRMSG